MNPMQAMPQQAPMGGRPPMGGQPPMGGPPPMARPMGPMGANGMPAAAANINLKQVQEDLKLMRDDQIIAYANGSQEKVVPSHMALGEMLRRKLINEKEVQAPQGTVKDNLEQQIKQAAGLASLAGQKQQQMQQQQMAQSMQAPGPVPGNIPSPQDQAEPPMMADGGLAMLPVNDRMVSYRDGGIVGYAEGEVVDKPYIGYRSPRRQEQPENPDFDENGNPRRRDERAAILAKNAMIAQQKAQSEKAAIRERQFQPVPQKEAMDQFYKERSTEGPVAATVAPQAAAPQAAPAAEPVNPPFDPSKPAMGKYDLSPGRMEGTLAAIRRIADPQDRERAMQAFTSQSGLAALPALPAAAAPQGEDRFQQADARNEEFLKRMREPVPLRPEQQAAINMPVEQDYMKRLRELAAKRGEEDVRTRADIEERKQMDLTRALLAGAEASRGYRGLGSLASGFARSSLGSREARMNEEAALRTAGLSREELLEKAQFEMNTLQRAIAVGDRERAEKSKLELDKIEEQLRGKTTMGAASVTGAAIGADTRAAVAAATAGQAGDTARSAAVKRAEDAYNNDAEVKQISKQLESPIFALGTTPAIKTQKAAMEKRREEIRRDKYRQQSITMEESTTASPLDLSKWGKPTKQ